MSTTSPSGLVGNRRALALGGVGLVALALLLARLAGGGGDPYAGLGAITSGPAGGVSSPIGRTPIVPTSGSTAPAAAHSDDSVSTAVRDPFCPFVVNAPTEGATSCPQQAPSILGQPMTLLDVFLDHQVPHARVRIAARTLTLHVGESFGLYRVASLSGDCGEFRRGARGQDVCKDQVWTGSGELPVAIS